MVQIVKNSVASESSSSNSKKVEEEKKKPVVAAEPPAAEPPAAADSSASLSPPIDEATGGSGRPQLRRQNSIGNGEISRLSSKLPKDYKFKFSSSTSFSKEEQQDSTYKENVVGDAGGAGGRPQLKRQNSIGNGEISRLSKKLPSSSRKSMFKKLLSFSTSSSKSSTSKSSSATSAASPGKE